jgi:predicted secreted protein
MSYTKSGAQKTKGTTLGIDTSTSGTPTYSVLGEITSIEPSGQQMGTVEVTNMDSAAKEYLSTIIDSGEFKVTYNRVSSDAGQTAVKTAFASGDLKSFQVTLPKASGQTVSGDTFTFDAIVTDYNLSSMAVDKALQVSVTLKISGLITEVAGS